MSDGDCARALFFFFLVVGALSSYQLLSPVVMYRKKCPNPRWGQYLLEYNTDRRAVFTEWCLVDQNLRFWWCGLWNIPLGSSLFGAFRYAPFLTLLPLQVISA